METEKKQDLNKFFEEIYAEMNSINSYEEISDEVETKAEAI